MIGRILSYLFWLRKLKFTPCLEKKRVSTTCEQKYEILVGLSICLGNIWNMFQRSSEKFKNVHLWWARQITIDRSWTISDEKKKTFYWKIACNVKHDWSLVKYDWPFGKNYMAIKVNHDRPMLNYDRPRSNTLPAGINQSRIYRKEKEGNFRI